MSKRFEELMFMTEHPKIKLYEMKLAVQFLNVKESQIRLLIFTEKSPVIQMGRLVRSDERGLIEFIERNKTRTFL